MVFPSYGELLDAIGEVVIGIESETLTAVFEHWMERLERMSQNNGVTIHKLPVGLFTFLQCLSGTEFLNLSGTPETGVLGADTIAYSTVTPYLRQRFFPTILVDLVMTHPRPFLTAQFQRPRKSAPLFYSGIGEAHLNTNEHGLSKLNTIIWICDEASLLGSPRPDSATKR
jgi:hypothetical protein